MGVIRHGVIRKSRVWGGLVLPKMFLNHMQAFVCFREEGVSNYVSLYLCPQRTVELGLLHGSIDNNVLFDRLTKLTTF